MPKRNSPNWVFWSKLSQKGIQEIEYSRINSAKKIIVELSGVNQPGKKLIGLSQSGIENQQTRNGRKNVILADGPKEIQ